MGPRRVGKTVMLYHTIDALLKNQVSPHHIAYISVEKNKIKLHFFPSTLYAYTVGRNTILLEQNRNG